MYGEKWGDDPLIFLGKLTREPHSIRYSRTAAKPALHRTRGKRAGIVLNTVAVISRQAKKVMQLEHHLSIYKLGVHASCT